MGTDFYTWVALLIVPVSNVITWMASRRVRKNEMLCTMQSSIDMLVAKNAELTKNIIDLRAENIKLRTELSKFVRQIEAIENGDVNKTIKKHLKK